MIFTEAKFYDGPDGVFYCELTGDIFTVERKGIMMSNHLTIENTYEVETDLKIHPQGMIKKNAFKTLRAKRIGDL